MLRALNIERAVLSRVGEFVSDYGTYQSARKISRQHKGRDLAEAEVAWLEWVIRELILRAGMSREGKGRNESSRLVLAASHKQDAVNTRLNRTRGLRPLAG